MTGKWRLTKQGETAKRIQRRHRFHSTALPCGRLVGSGAIRRQTCGGEHDPEWTARAQHEAHTAIMGLSCRKNYHNLGNTQAVLMENPGIR